jgi:hypothetical protein
LGIGLRRPTPRRRKGLAVPRLSSRGAACWSGDDGHAAGNCGWADEYPDWGHCLLSTAQPVGEPGGCSPSGDRSVLPKTARLPIGDDPSLPQFLRSALVLPRGPARQEEEAAAELVRTRSCLRTTRAAAVAVTLWTTAAKARDARAQFPWEYHHQRPRALPLQPLPSARALAQP